MFFKATPQKPLRIAIKSAVQHWACGASIAPRHRLPIKGLLVGLMLAASCGTALSDDLFGRASVVDGDTLEIHATRIRLWGIDAPESTQLCRGEDSLQYRCGAKAANDLDAFIGGRPVSCTPISLDQYGRTVATCSVNGTWPMACQQRPRARLAELLARHVR
jgi:Staphylococcal nuclease homologue